MSGRAWVDASVELDGCQRLRIGAILLEAGDALLLQLLEFGGIESRLLRHVGDEREHCRNATTNGLDDEGRTIDSTAHTHRRPKQIKAILELLSSECFRAALQHGRRELTSRAMALQGFLGAKAHHESTLHCTAARLLLEQAQSHSVRKCNTTRARVDVGGRRVERFAYTQRAVALVLAHECGDIHLGRNFRAVRFRRWIEHADGDVRRLQIVGGHALNVRGRHALEAIAVHEQEPPITGRLPLAQGEPDLVRIVEEQGDVLEQRRLRPLHLGFRWRTRPHAVDTLQEHRSGRLERALLPYLRVRDQHSRFSELKIECTRGRRELRHDERLIQSPRRLASKHVCEHVNSREVRMRERRHVVHCSDNLHVAHATQRDRALAILRGLGGIRGIENVSVIQ